MCFALHTLLCTINHAVCAPLCIDTQTKAGIQCKQKQHTLVVSLLQMNPTSLSSSWDDTPADVKIELADVDVMQPSQVQSLEVSLNELSEDVELIGSDGTHSYQDATAGVCVCVCVCWVASFWLNRVPHCSQR